MKKIICTFLAIIMVMSLVACKSNEAPVVTTPAEGESTPVVVDPVVDATDDPNQETTSTNDEPEPTTESERVPSDVEAVDPAALPEPIPVEEQLRGEDAQTLVLGSLDEYQELLWNLGFNEMSLDNTCTPISITYTPHAFRLNFSYVNNNNIENDWYIYGTKSNAAANISKLIEDNWNVQRVDRTTTSINTSDPTFFYDEIVVCSIPTRANILRIIYFPYTGNLYNYLQDPDNEGSTDGVMQNTVEAKAVGQSAYAMTYHVSTNKTGTNEMQSNVEHRTDEKELAEAKAFAKQNHALEINAFAPLPGYHDILYYEADMTWEEWAASDYNCDGWVWEEEEGSMPALWSPCRQYVIAVLYNANTSQPLSLGEIFKGRAHAKDCPFMTLFTASEWYKNVQGKGLRYVDPRVS